MKAYGRGLLLCVALCVPALAQSPAEAMQGKPWDIGIYVGGGTSVPGGTKDTQVINAGFRVGKILTNEIGSGILRGNFEYAVEALPLYTVLQPGKNAVGVGITPLVLKWNFTAPKKVSPYIELSGSALFTNNDVPRFTSNVNFISGASLGVHLFTHTNRAVTLAARYQHISNAGLSTPNPGINTVQFTIGYNWFRR
jgi:hypothetical protein